MRGNELCADHVARDPAADLQDSIPGTRKRAYRYGKEHLARREYHSYRDVLSGAEDRGTHVSDDGTIP